MKWKNREVENKRNISKILKKKSRSFCWPFFNKNINECCPTLDEMHQRSQNMISEPHRP